jgi:hypothetical protein
MAHEDAAPAAINQPGQSNERRPRPLKRWRLFVAGKGRSSFVAQSPDTEPKATQSAPEHDRRNGAG